MIPRVIHQTYKSSAVPDGVRPLMASWTARNPGWVMRFYDDATCRQFVRGVPGIQPSVPPLRRTWTLDFFRYLVVLHTGGVYADIDRSVAAHWTSFCAPRTRSWWDGRGVRDEWRTRGISCGEQVLNWVLAGRARVTAREICDHIARSVTESSRTTPTTTRSSARVPAPSRTWSCGSFGNTPARTTRSRRV